MTIRRVKDLDSNLSKKIVLIRVDFNVPIKNGVVIDETRIISAIQTIYFLLKRGAKIVMLSHLGRPKDKEDKNLSLRPIAEILNKLQINKIYAPEMPLMIEEQYIIGGKNGIKIKFVENCIGEQTLQKIKSMKSNEILLLENLRFHKGETQNDENFARELAKLGDIYVNEAFSCSHRKHASIVSLPKFMLEVAIGDRFAREISHIDNISSEAQEPIMAIVGGAKIATKINLLKKLSNTVNHLVIGGAIANCFLKYQGINIGKSLHDDDAKDDITDIIKIAERNSCKITLPEDVVVTTYGHQDPKTKYRICPVKDVRENEIILDIGHVSACVITQIMNRCNAFIWNGPLGICEDYGSSINTARIAQNLATRLTIQEWIPIIVGGGDTVEAINRLGLFHKCGYISTGGGALLQYITDSSLVGLESLKR